MRANSTCVACPAKGERQCRARHRCDPPHVCRGCLCPLRQPLCTRGRRAVAARVGGAGAPRRLAAPPDPARRHLAVERGRRPCPRPRLRSALRSSSSSAALRGPRADGAELLAAAPLALLRADGAAALPAPHELLVRRVARRLVRRQAAALLPQRHLGPLPVDAAAPRLGVTCRQLALMHCLRKPRIGSGLGRAQAAPLDAGVNASSRVCSSATAPRLPPRRAL